MKPLMSPLTGRSDVALIKTIDVAELVADYQRLLGIDISSLMRDQREIFLYQCNDSGFRFYYPFDIIGDSNFYHQLESHDWYYMPVKWEFEASIRHIQGGRILEIGSGKGDFLSLVRKKIGNAEVLGLELNEEAVKVAQSRGINVLTESFSEHAKLNPERYDVVASFQVLEHIPNPIDFLRDSINMLKPGGRMIIGVPDNSERAFPSLFVTLDNIANMPPHHQGLWDLPSLTYLPKILPLQLKYIATEPATASHHSNSYRGLMKQDLMQRFGPIFGFGIYALGRPFYDHALKHLNKYLPSHSILAIYRKIGY